nr:retrovirus-related Pol polyprotein from transposon TNT 1-94 [Tanacetum cinerariifolium]
MTESPLVDSGFDVPVFSSRDDLIACLNKAMAFLTAVASSMFSSTNNQLRTSYNPRNHATIQDVLRETMQVDRKGLLNATTVKHKAMLAEAQEAGKFLDEEQLAFLADLGVLDGQVVQTIIPHNVALHTKDLDTYDSDYDDISNPKAVPMANISNYGSDVISEVTHSETYLNDMENQKMFKLDLDPLAPKLLQNREDHIDYLKYTQEQADILRGIVEQTKAKQPLDNALDFACRTFTIVGNSFPLTRITSANVVPPKKTTSHSVETQKLELKVYSKKPKNVKNVVQIVFWYLDSGCSKHMTGNRSQLMNFVSKFLGTVRFKNDHIERIIGYGDYQLGNVTISRVSYVEGLSHNLIFVGQFCDADLEVAFRKNTCFICNFDGVDLLLGSRDTNLYTISLDDMLKTSSICLLSKALKTKIWLWHRRLSHISFGTLNKPAKDGLARGIPRLKFQKDHLCSACALGNSKKSSHQPKDKDTNQEKLYLLHIDLCGPMRVVSINGKIYILVIVDDYSRFTCVIFLRTKDEAPEAIIKCIKNIQVRLNATVRIVRTDNGTEFVN